jgi:hypothetical protein
LLIFYNPRSVRKVAGLCKKCVIAG